MLGWAAITPVFLVAGQLTAQLALLRFGKQHVSPRRAVVVGLTDLGMRLTEKLREDVFLSIDVLGFFDERAISRLPNSAGSRVLGVPSSLPDYIAQKNVNVVYITLPMTRHPRILELLDMLKDSTVSIYFVPDLFVFDLIQARFDLISGIPVVAVCESPFYGMRGIAKRLSDLVLASFILLCIWPLLALLAAGVKLSSPGPAIFRQRRYGLDGKQIVIYKFRTMSVCEDGARVQQAQLNDSRITPFGKFLRKTSLDELPQFINVLQGRMSVVGPRPHAVAHNEEYRKVIDGYMIRHKVRPGITGLAQVKGFRGETETAEKMEQRIHYDLEYLRNWSLGLDLSIIFKTFSVLLGDRNAY
jgi:putative colanic acid biosynthesis UDP-glucose lipid carrier transferase